MPNLKQHFYAAQVKFLVCTCCPQYEGKWKDRGKRETFHIQASLGDIRNKSAQQSKYEIIKQTLAVPDLNQESETLDSDDGGTGVLQQCTH